MACDNQTLIELTATDGFPALSSRDKLICLASVYGTAAGYANAQTALDAASTNGYHALSDADLDKAFLAAIC